LEAHFLGEKKKGRSPGWKKNMLEIIDNVSKRERERPTIKEIRPIAWEKRKVK